MAYRALVPAGTVASGRKSTYFASGAASRRNTSSGSSTIRTVPFRCTSSKTIYRSPGSTRNASRASGLMWATFFVGGVLITIVCSSTTYQTGSDTGLLSRRRMVRIPVWALSLVLAEPDPVSTTVSEKICAALKSTH